MFWSVLFLSIIFVFVGLVAYCITMATTIGWSRNGKIDWSGWFDEYKSVLYTVWGFVIFIYVVSFFALIP
jgi:hypothetical protein